MLRATFKIPRASISMLGLGSGSLSKPSTEHARFIHRPAHRYIYLEANIMAFIWISWLRYCSFIFNDSELDVFLSVNQYFYLLNCDLAETLSFMTNWMIHNIFVVLSEMTMVLSISIFWPEMAKMLCIFIVRCGTTKMLKILHASILYSKLMMETHYLYYKALINLIDIYKYP